jgi:phosphoglycolate phosphatase/AHBA synthesis associated protein
VAEVEAYYNRHFRDHAERVRTNPEAKKVLAALRERGCKIAVITNTPSPIARDVLRIAELEPDVLVGGTDVPRGKPAPDMVFKALDGMSVSKEKAILVGDSHFDREAAAAAGLRFIHYNIEAERLDRVLLEIDSMND